MLFFFCFSGVSFFVLCNKYLDPCACLRSWLFCSERQYTTSIEDTEGSVSAFLPGPNSLYMSGNRLSATCSYSRN